MSESLSCRLTALSQNRRWKDAEKELKAYSKKHEPSHTDKLSTYFYARWMAGYQCPRFLTQALIEDSADGVRRFMDDEINRQNVLVAFNIHMRMSGSKPFNVEGEKDCVSLLSALLGRPFCKAYAIKSFRAEPTQGQKKIIDQVTREFSLKRQMVNLK